MVFNYLKNKKTKILVYCLKGSDDFLIVLTQNIG